MLGLQAQAKGLGRTREINSMAITGPVVAGSLIDLTGKNYAILWLFSALFIALAAGLMQRQRPHKAVPS